MSVEKRQLEPVFSAFDKNNYVGNDEDVLNLDLENLRKSKPKFDFNSITNVFNASNKKVSYIAMGLLILIIVIVLSIGGIYLYKSMNPDDLVANKIEIESVNNVESDIKEVETAKTGEDKLSVDGENQKENSFDKSVVKIQILNGSGVVGYASEIAGALENIGYKNIETGNADSYDHEGVVIRVRKEYLGEYDAFSSEMEEELELKLDIGDNISNDGDYDVIMILGK